MGINLLLWIVIWNVPRGTRQGCPGCLPVRPGPAAYFD